jgi:hypothetical protein
VNARHGPVIRSTYEAPEDSGSSRETNSIVISVNPSASAYDGGGQAQETKEVTVSDLFSCCALSGHLVLSFALDLRCSRRGDRGAVLLRDAKAPQFDVTDEGPGNCAGDDEVRWARMRSRWIV